MQTMKFRKSRLVILAVFLLLVTSLGYWLMYTSRPRSQLHSSVSSDVILAYRQRIASSRKKGSADEDGDYVGPFRNKDRNRGKAEARRGIDGLQGDNRGSFQQLRASDVHASTGSKQVNKAAELKKDDIDDYSDADEAKKDVDTVADEQQHKDAEIGNNRRPAVDNDYNEHQHKDVDRDNKRRPAVDNVYNDDYKDDAERPIELDNVSPSKNSKPDSNVRRDHETVYEKPSVAKQRKEDDEGVADGDMKFDSKKQLRDADVIDGWQAPVMKPKMKHRHDVGADVDGQAFKWKRHSKETEVSFHFQSLVSLQSSIRYSTLTLHLT